MMKSVCLRFLSGVFILCFAQNLAARSSQNPIDKKSVQNLEVNSKKQNALLNERLDIKSTKPFSLKNQWEVLPQVSANPSSGATDNPETLNKVGNFKLKTAATQSTEKQFIKSSPMVLRNKRSQSFGVLTGTLVVTLGSPQDDITSILKDYDLTLLQPFKHLAIYFVTSKHQIFDLENTYILLSKDSRIKNLDVEIISRTYEKK